MRGARFPPLHPGQLRVLVIAAICLVLVVLAVLLIEFLLQGSASILHRLTGRRPPRRSWMANEIDRIESQLRRHDPPG